MELQVGVKALIRNSSGKYLLIHRSSKKYPEINNLWDIPGGRINPGSPLIENLLREINEETGLEITDDPALLGAQDILRIPGRHVVRLTYLLSASGEVVIDQEEHDDFKWLDLDEVLNIEKLDIYVKELLTNSSLK